MVSGIVTRATAESLLRLYCTYCEFRVPSGHQQLEPTAGRLPRQSHDNLVLEPVRDSESLGVEASRSEERVANFEENKREVDSKAVVRKENLRWFQDSCEEDNFEGA